MRVEGSALLVWALLHGEHSVNEFADTTRSAEETILGVDVESPAAVALAVIVSVALALGLWLYSLRWLTLAAAAVAIVFAVFDIAEAVHQVDESRTGLVLPAGVIAVGHGAAAAAAGWATRRQGEP